MRAPTRPGLLIHSLLVLLLFGSAPLQAKDLPNVLLLSVDTLRADALGTYGYPHDVSPVLDALAARGVLFEDAQTVIGKTGPSFATVFSSLYPPTHGARRNGVAMRDDVPVLAELLSEQGYRTGAFISNWTLRERLAAVHRGFDHYDETFDRKRYGVTAPERAAETVTASALKWVGAQSEKDPDQPIFLWVHFSEPHTPYVLHEDLAPPKPPPSERRAGWEKRWRYASEIAFTDRAVGRLLEGIETHMPDKERVSLFISDHGESMGEHGYWGHGKNAHWANLHVPMFFWGRGIPHGQRLESPASLVDVAPTLLDILGLESPKGFAGISLKTAWAGSFDDQRRRFAFGDRHTALRQRSRTTYKNPLELSLVIGSLKAVYSFETKDMRYYDLSKDPAENNPLDALPEDLRPPVGRQLATWYRGLQKFESRSGVLSEEDLEQLKSLGYVGAP